MTGGTLGRRVAGLRREEVAVLNGVSVDYYARLEQGRERNPSAQVIDAIGRCFRLAPQARSHLYRLAGLNPSLGPDTTRDRVHPQLLRLLDAFPLAAAYVLGPALDVLLGHRLGVHIGQHDRRVVAPELEGDPGQGRRGAGHDVAARRGRSGEADLVEAGGC
ncbi:helix-turn-helix domain-containing protein [Actinoplanes sp. NPDC051494]|uniref:helix-turn-helix domain-containing protein n=1 Tax=Actinoplanes sp. NPDC051494 TaxID=3363907 RepID=UPI0037BDF048